MCYDDTALPYAEGGLLPDEYCPDQHFLKCGKTGFELGNKSYRVINWRYILVSR